LGPVSFRYTALYPFLLVAVRIMFVAANNPGHYDVPDLLVVLAAALGGTAIVFGLAVLVFRGRNPDLPPLVTMVIVGWYFAAPAVAAWFPEPLRLMPPVLAIMGLLVSGLFVYGLARHPRSVRVGATFLTHTYAVLVVWLGIDIVQDLRHGRQQVASSPLVRELARPIAGPATAPGPVRDIYVIVLDEYANSAVLQAVLRYDNSAFEDSLRALGFHLPRLVRSNYTQTSLSLASLLNTAHVAGLKDELAHSGADATVLNHLVQDNRVARYLRARGYRFVLFPSSWWFATHTSPVADSVVQVGPRLSLGRALSRTEFRRAIWHNSVTGWFHREEHGDDQIVVETFEGMRRLAADPRPTFAVAHVLSPHVPYVFTSTCGPRAHTWHRYPSDYEAQLQCVNRLVLATVTDLIRNSEVAPVIVLQGDHGTAFLEYSNSAGPSRVAPTAAAERLGAFGAYYLPDGGSKAFGDTAAVVNVLGNVLRIYLGADLAAAPDERYISLDQAPFDLAKVEVPSWSCVASKACWWSGDPDAPRSFGAARTPPLSPSSAGPPEGSRAGGMAH
jgi:hypothetical protein